MEVRNCKNCGRLFNYVGGTSYKNLCPACIDLLEDKFQEVKKYVQDNPHCTINQISDEMDVPVRQIERWIRDERLCFADDSPIGIACERCGKMIKTGRYCDMCKNEIGNQMSSLYKAVDTKERRGMRSTGNKMRYLDK